MRGVTRTLKNIGTVEHATLECVDWYDYKRLSDTIGDFPSAGFEAAC